MIASKKLSASTAILPAIYLIIGNLLYFGLALNAKIPDVVFAFLFEPYLRFIFLFEIIVLGISLVLTHVLVEKTKIGDYKNLIRFSPFINILIGLSLVMNFSFIGSIAVVTCALITAISLYLQRKE